MPLFHWNQSSPKLSTWPVAFSAVVWWLPLAICGQTTVAGLLALLLWRACSSTRQLVCQSAGKGQAAACAQVCSGVLADSMLAGWASGTFDIHYPKRFTRVMKLLRLLPYRAYFPAVRRATGL